MKKSVLFLIIVFIFSVSLPALNLNVITESGNVIKGEFMGISDGVLFLDSGGKSSAVPVEKIKKIFNDDSGEAMDIGSLGAGKETQSNETAADGGKKTTDGAVEAKKFWMFIYGNLQSGLVAYQPMMPLTGVYSPGAAYVIGSKPFDSAWGAGFGIEYRLHDMAALCFDGGISRWEKLLAKEGGYGVGDWVFEQTGYSDARVGFFPMDVTYYMDTTIMRLGAKFYPITGMFQPWVGLSGGLYGWQATIGNRIKEKKYSETSSGYALSASYQGGLDIVLGEFVFRLFGDFATAVAQPKFEDLFLDGWTFEIEGGQHVDGPYKIGAALGIFF